VCGLQVLEDTATGCLTRKRRQCPVFSAPVCCVHALEGYTGGAFDPEKRGAAYIVAGEVEDVIRVNNSDAKWGLNPLSLVVNSSATSQPLLRKVTCTLRPRGKNSAPDTNFTAYKYYLEEPGFFALDEHPAAADFLALDDQPSAAEPSTEHPPVASEPAPAATDPSGALEASAPAASASKPAGKNTQLHPYPPSIPPVFCGST
jgi:hypothetical protein